MRLVRKVLSDRLLLSALGVVLVLVVTVAYLFGSVLNQPLTHRPAEVTVKLTAAGGLYQGSAATYRGVSVGKVTEIEVTDEGVEATVELTSDERIPADSLAQVRSLSPVGEQYLDFRPRTRSGPYLHDGSVIEASSTDIPKSLASTVIALNNVLEQVDDKKLHSLLVELSTGLKGTGGDIGRMVDEGGELIRTLDDIYPETDRLLHNGGTVLDIATSKRGELTRLAGTAKQLAAFLKDYSPELAQTIKQTPGQIKTLQGLIDDARKVLPDFLSKGVSISDIFAAHDPHIATLLTEYSDGLGVLSSHISDGTIHLKFILDDDNRCKYSTPRRGPRDTSPRKLKAYPGCSGSISTLMRGSDQAPGPVRR